MAIAEAEIWRCDAETDPRVSHSWSRVEGILGVFAPRSSLVVRVVVVASSSSSHGPKLINSSRRACRCVATLPVIDCLWTCFSCLVISPLVIFHLLPLSSSSPHHLRNSAAPARFAHRLQTLDDQTLAVAPWTPTATISPTTLALPPRPCAPPPDFDPVELQGFAASHPAISTPVAPLLPTPTSCQASSNPLFHLQT